MSPSGWSGLGVSHSWSGPVAVTGAGGFLGWHVRVLAHALGMPPPIMVSAADLGDPDRLATLLDGVDRVVHLAATEQGAAKDIFVGNIELAEALAAGLRRCPAPPATVVFANSLRAGDGTPYGEGKAAAASRLADAAPAGGWQFLDLALPSVFGEHDRPRRTSVVATFAQSLADGRPPVVTEDGELDLLHATDAAALLLGVDPPDGAAIRPTRRTVGQLAYQLARFAESAGGTDLPDLTDRFNARLYNAYRSHLPPAGGRLAGNADASGEVHDIVNGRGHTSFSSTRPGATRGGFVHLVKVERVLVVRGTAEIRLRRLLHDEIVTIPVTGREPSIVEIPTMWAHDVTNVGDDELLTVLWDNGEAGADSYREPVA